MGSRSALQMLQDGPECPDGLRYLLRWLVALHGHSGTDMDGFAPLSYTTVAAWVQLTRTDVRPYEVEALMKLDAVLRHPERDWSPKHGS